MGKDLYLVLWGAAAGLASAVILEFVKHKLERIRSVQFEADELVQKRSEQVADFLRGEGQPASIDPALALMVDHPSSTVPTKAAQPYPAWLQQVSVARRNPLARLGLRSDEDYGTDTHRVAEEGGSRKRSTTLLKTFRKGRTKARRPSKSRGGKFLLGPAHILGRSSKCDIQIRDPAISLLHAFIRLEGDQYMLYDLGSTGGTYVNDEPVGVMGVPLSGGEIIRMGSTTFEFGRVFKDDDGEEGGDPFFVI